MMLTPPKFSAAILVLIFASFLLVILVRANITAPFDLSLHDWAVGVNSPHSVMFWRGLSLLGSVAVVSGFTIASLGIFILMQDWLGFRLMAFTMIGAVVIDNASKWLIGRQRPVEIYPNTLPTSYSFPSGHAFFNFLFYVALAIILSRKLPIIWANSLWAVAIMVVVLIGASRIFLGVHYVTDVLGGYLFAAVWLLIILRMLNFRFEASSDGMIEK